VQGDLGLLAEELASTVCGLTAYQTQTAPRDHPDRWTIQQVVEHLLQTYRGSIPTIQARIDKGYGTRAFPSLRQRIGQLGVLTFGYFPSGREAPASVCPPPVLTVRCGDELAAQIAAELVRLDAVTREGETVFGARRAVSHFVLGPLSMRQWRRFHLVHGRHHVKQISAIRLDHGF
jgi:hypothetical protein